jgi:hypothetical protein
VVEYSLSTCSSNPVRKRPRIMAGRQMRIHDAGLACGCSFLSTRTRSYLDCVLVVFFLSDTFLKRWMVGIEISTGFALTYFWEDTSSIKTREHPSIYFHCHEA